MLNRGIVGVGLLSLALLVSSAMAGGGFNVNAYYAPVNLGGVAENFAGTPLINFQAYGLTDAGTVTGYGMDGGYGSAGPPPIPWQDQLSWTAASGLTVGYQAWSSNGGVPGAGSGWPLYPYETDVGNDAGTTVWTDTNGVGNLIKGGVLSQPAALAQGANWINSSGLVAAGSIENGSPGYVYNTNTSTTVASLPGAGLFINNAGQVGGTTTSWGGGFVWNQNASTYWPAGSTMLSNFASVDAVSQNGKYAVGQDTGFANGLLYTATGSGTGTTATLSPGWAYSVNNNGWVGGDTDASSEFGGTAWLWDGTTLHNLNTELQAAYASVVSNYTICACWGINDSNQVLVWGKETIQTPDGPVSWIESFLMTPALLGDANKDGKVDINDLTIVLSHYDQTGATWTQGEFTGSGRVDINDLTIVLAHYNQTAGASGAGIAAVPEPATLLLAASGLLGLLAWAWRKRTSAA